MCVCVCVCVCVFVSTYKICRYLNFNTSVLNTEQSFYTCCKTKAKAVSCEVV